MSSRADIERAAPSHIEARDVTHVYDGDSPTVALERISFEAVPGEVTCLVGPSGCGKSTLLDLVAGLQTPTSGKVLQDGEEILGTNLTTAMAFQTPALLPWLTVGKNVALGLRVRGVRRDQAGERARSVLDRVGLGDVSEKYPDELSGGMAQRVGIARALALTPTVLLMDEPFSAVDAYTRLRLQRELRSIIEANPTTVLFVTHDIAEAVTLGDRIVVMSPRPGRVVDIIKVAPEAHDPATAEHAALAGQVFGMLLET